MIFFWHWLLHDLTSPVMPTTQLVGGHKNVEYTVQSSHNLNMMTVCRRSNTTFMCFLDFLFFYWFQKKYQCGKGRKFSHWQKKSQNHELFLCHFMWLKLVIFTFIDRFLIFESIIMTPPLVSEIFSLSLPCEQFFSCHF